MIRFVNFPSDSFTALENLGLSTEDEDLKDDGNGITLDKFKDEV